MCGDPWLCPWDPKKVILCLISSTGQFPREEPSSSLIQGWRDISLVVRALGAQKGGGAFLHVDVYITLLFAPKCLTCTLTCISCFQVQHVSALVSPDNTPTRGVCPAAWGEKESDYSLPGFPPSPVPTSPSPALCTAWGANCRASGSQPQSLFPGCFPPCEHLALSLLSSANSTPTHPNLPVKPPNFCRHSSSTKPHFPTSLSEWIYAFLICCLIWVILGSRHKQVCSNCHVEPSVQKSFYHEKKPQVRSLG